MTKVGPGSYRRLLAAATLSNVGDGIRLTALPLLAVTLTREPVLVSGLLAAAYLPWLVFGLPVGVLVDRTDRARLMAVANLARAVLLGMLAVLVGTGNATLWVLYLVAFAVGVAEAAHDNAAQSLVPHLVPNADLERANGQVLTVESVGQDLAGPALGGLLFAAVAAAPFGVNAAGAAVSAALVRGLPAPPVTRAGPLRLRGVFRDARTGCAGCCEPRCCAR